MAYRTSKAAVELASLATLAPLVMASRMTNFWLAASSPTEQSCGEINLMVTEKIQAITESTIAMNMAAVRIGLDSAFNFLSNRSGTSDFLEDLDKIAAAGLKPYANKVRANRKRLSRD